MSGLRAFTRTWAFNVLVVALATGTALQIVLGQDAPAAPRKSPWLLAPLAAAVVLMLLGWRRWPFAGPAAMVLGGTACTFVDGRLVPFTAGFTVAGLVASFLLGQVRDPVKGRIGLVLAVASAVIVVANQPGHATGDLFFTPLPFAVAWLAGHAVRQGSQRTVAAELRARQAEHEREAAARVAVAEERARIARELHDVVAHALSVIVLQVGAVRHTLPASMRDEREALGDVERAGRTALTEMRRLLGALRREDDDVELAPEPGLDRLPALLDQVRRAGLPVDLQIEGVPLPLPRTLDMSGYRVVQEGLTNAMKHARASRADVVVRYRPTCLEVQIRDDGRGPTSTDGHPPGHGLIGIAERVKIYGGQMSADSRPGGGFILSARFPLELRPGEGDR